LPKTIILIDLESFREFRVIDECPGLGSMLRRPREMATQVFDVLARGGWYSSNRHILNALRVSRFAVLDSIYACQLSKDQSLLFTANRGLNHITVYDYPSNEIRLRVSMPPLQEFVPHVGKYADPRLGFHHGWLVSTPEPETGTATVK
jgi:hypothetical protein